MFLDQLWKRVGTAHLTSGLLGGGGGGGGGGGAKGVGRDRGDGAASV